MMTKQSLDEAPSKQRSLRMTSARSAQALLAALTCCASALPAQVSEPWSPQDMIAQQQATEVARLAANTYFHAPLLVDLRTLDYQCIENDLLETSALGTFLLRQKTPDNEHSASFGRGWAGVWDTRIKIADGTPTLKIPGKMDVVFELQGATFQRKDGRAGTLKHSENGSWMLQEGPVATEFNPDGLLTAIRGPVGQVRFSYSNSDHLATASSGDQQVRFTTDVQRGWITGIEDVAGGKTATFRYSPEGLLLAVIRPDKTSCQYQYDDSGRLTGVDASGTPEVTLSYFGNGKLSGIITKGMAISNFTSEETPNVRRTRVSTADGSFYSCEFSAEDRSVIINDSAGNHAIKTYDSNGRLLRYQAPDGSESMYHYGPGARIERIERSGYGVETYSYDSRGNLIEVSHPTWVTKASYNQTGLLDTFTDEYGRITRYFYGKTSQQLESLQAPGGNRVAFAYDEAGHLKSIETDGVVTAKYQWNATGQLLSVSDPDGGESYAYDSIGRVTKILHGGKLQKSFVYDDEAGSVMETSPSGLKITRKFDEHKRLTQFIAPGGRDVANFEYDIQGRVTREQISGAERQFEYDAMGNLIKLALPDGSIRSLDWNASGNLTATRDSGGSVHAFEYDKQGRLVEKICNQTGTSRFTYDSLGRILEDSLSTGVVRKFDYDPETRFTASVQLGESLYKRSFDPKQRLETITLPSGAVLTAKWNALDQILSRTWADGRKVSYEYDNAGRMKLIQSNGRSTTFDYDARGRPQAVTVNKQKTVGYAYDPEGNLRSVQLPDRIYHYEYTWDGFLSKKSDSLTGHSVALDRQGRFWTRLVLDDTPLINRSISSSGKLESISGPSGAEVRIKRDQVGRIQEIEYGKHLRAEYQYTDSGLVREIVWKDTNGEVVYHLAYLYDSQGRRVSTDYNGETHSYTYGPGYLQQVSYSDGGRTTFNQDKNGNLISKGRGRWRFNAADQIMQDGAAHFVHDHDGNLESISGSRTSVRCTYNSRGQLEMVRKGSSTINYTYGAEGELLSRTVDDQQLSFESIRSNHFAQWENGTLTRIWLTGDAPDTRYACIEGDTVSYLITDTLNNILAEVSPDGSILRSRTYTPFGMPREDRPVSGFSFQGHWRDPDTGWIYFRTRWYDPEYGRFIQPDASDFVFEHPETLNRYAFVNNEPVNYADPWGHAPNWLDPFEVIIPKGASDMQALQTAHEAFMSLPKPAPGTKLNPMIGKGYKAAKVNAFGKDGIAYDVWIETLPNGSKKVAFRPFAEAGGGPYGDPTKMQAHIEGAKMKGPQAKGLPPKGVVVEGGTAEGAAVEGVQLSRGARVVKWGGRIMIIYGAYHSLKNIYNSTDWKNQTGREAAGWSASWVLGSKGAAIGLTYGSTLGPWGATIGSVGGGLIGGVSGYFLGQGAFDWATGSSDDSTYISVALDQSDWYCTNRPYIQSAVNLPDIISHERERRLELLEKTKKSEAEIRASLEAEAQRIQMEFQKKRKELTDLVNESIKDVNENTGRNIHGDIIDRDTYMTRMNWIKSNYEKQMGTLQTQEQWALKCLLVKQGKTIQRLRDKFSEQTPYLPPPVIPPAEGPFGRPYGEPAMGIQK